MGKRTSLHDNKVAPHFVKFLTQWDIELPSTYEAWYARPCAPTFVATDGSLSCIDFVGVRRHNDVPHIESDTLTGDVDLAMTKEDHFATYASVEISGSGGRQLMRRRYQLCDPKKFRNPEHAAPFIEYVQGLPRIPWTMDSTAHAELLGNWL